MTIVQRNALPFPELSRILCETLRSTFQSRCSAPSKLLLQALPHLLTKPSACECLGASADYAAYLPSSSASSPSIALFLVAGVGVLSQ